MKVFFLAGIIFLCSSFAEAQVLKRLGDRAKQKIEQKAGDKVDKGIDDALDKKSKEKIETEEGEVKVKTDGDETKIKTESKGPGLKAYSKYDFLPGEKIIYAEDFSQDVVGEFPVKWNTNGSGEIVSLEGLPGKWLQMIEGTEYTSGYAGKLPDNYTVEFDLVVEFKDDQSVPEIQFKIFKPTNNGWNSGIELGFNPNNGTHTSQGEQTTADRARLHTYDSRGQYYLQGKDQLHAEFTKYNHKAVPVHIAVWVQKERLRAWVNQQKIYDVPKGVLPNALFERLGFSIASYGGAKANYQYYVSNIKLAVAPPDTRSKLITEGKFITTGITFDVNSDKIKPTSYGVLKEIAATLKENPEVKVKIIGHTDSDGDDAKNLDLSKRRAASVRIVLTNEFGIEGSRFETDGLGDTKPLADNKTSEGKAQNRRVEFVKL